jgi:hypothetical protein
MERKHRILLSGAISNDPYYEEKFSAAAIALHREGYAVMNPAALPSRGFTHRQYMHVTIAMLDVCDILCLLPDWQKSPGAVMEFIRAILTRKIIVTYNELITDPDCIGGGHGLLQNLRALRRIA